MASPLIQQLAQHLGVEPEDAGHALEFFARSIKQAAQEQGRVDIPGLGSLIYEDETLSFHVEASLALAVNNRYAALETETVHVAVRDNSSETLHAPDSEPAGDTLPASVGLEPADFPPVESEAAGQIEEPELSVSESFRAEDQEGLLSSDGPVEEETILLESESVDPTPPETPQFQSEFAPTQSVDDEPADSADFQFDAPESMNDETPEVPPNNDSQNSQSDTEWSSIFGKLEDQATFENLEEQNTFEMPEDPNASRWIDSEPPMPPPTSPFADSREPDSAYNQGEVEDTLFARPADSDYTPLFIDSAADESSWADVPVEDASGLFDTPNTFDAQPENPTPATPQPPPAPETPSFGDLSDAETIYTTPSDEFSQDEFMPPVSAASTPVESDDTLFNAEPYISPEDSTVHEQNNDSFFMPDEAVASIGSTPAYSDITEHFAPIEEEPLKAEPVEQPAPPTRPPTRSRYERRRNRQGSGSFLLVALVLVGVLIVGAGVGVFAGFLPMPAFLQSGDAESTELATGEPQTPPSGTETVPAIPPTTEELEAANAANSETTSTPATTPEPPAFQRRPIERAAGGWTIIVSSEQIKSLAEEKADVFAQNVQDQNLPVGVLDARVNGQIWYRVGIGQFPSRAAAQAVQRRLGSAIPGDAWLTEL